MKMKKMGVPILIALFTLTAFIATANLYAQKEQCAEAEMDRSIQVYKRGELTAWNREKAGGGSGPLLGEFSYTRNQTGNQDAFKEIGWLMLPKGASIGLHKHSNNEDVYIIISGKGLFTDSNGTEIEVGPGDITIARPGQSHALKNIGEEPLVFINAIAQLASS